MKEYHKIPIEKLAYFAGILDGEGCIRIGRTKSQNGLHNYDYRGYIQIGMTAKEVLDWIVENIGGKYYEAKNKSLLSKVSFNWFMNPKEASVLLQAILPFLILKRKQAECFIEYAQTVTTKPGLKGLGTSVIEQRETIYNKITQLNKKGVRYADLPQNSNGVSQKPRK